MKMAKSKKPIFEIVWYTITGAVALWGLTYVVLGTICSFIPLDSGLAEANNAIVNNFGLGFLYWGLIILAIASLAAIIVLLSFAKRVDRDFEKKQRRSLRRSGLTESETTADEIIDAAE